MDRDPRSYAREWLQKGEQDLRRVEALLAIDDAEGSAFHLQQAAEKFLKAFLISRGWKLKKTHDLEFLLGEAVTHDPSLAAYRPVGAALTQLYVSERYPNSHGFSADREDLKQYLKDIQPLLNLIREAVGA